MSRENLTNGLLWTVLVASVLIAVLAAIKQCRSRVAEPVDAPAVIDEPTEFRETLPATPAAEENEEEELHEDDVLI